MYLATITSKTNTRHAYELEVEGGTVKVFAYSRWAARVLAEMAGYVVRSVNMVG